MRILIATDAWHPQVNGVVRTLTSLARSASSLDAAVSTMIPADIGYALLRHFHSAASMTMVATASLRQELSERGFRKLGFWTRGVDTQLFTPDDPTTLDLPRPIFMTMGRVAVEKNLEAFLSLDLPGTMVVAGDGPQRMLLAQKHPNAVL